MLHFVTSYMNQNEKTLESAQYGLEIIVKLPNKGGDIRDTKTFNLLRNIVSLQVFVDVSPFSPCVINLSRNNNICCEKLLRNVERGST